MITRDDYFKGRDLTYDNDYTDAIEQNSIVTIRAANQLLIAFGQDRGVNSGWRPPAINALTAHASPTSLHMTGQAIDIEDETGELDAWCMAHQKVLEALGLWLEHPVDTPRWCHVQTIAQHSGNRVFYA